MIERSLLDIELNSNNIHYLENAGRDDQKKIEIHFLVCRSCFWCASELLGNHDIVFVCPTCFSDKLESLPLTLNDGFRKVMY